MVYLLPHAEEGISVGVEEEAAVVDADEGALDPDHDGAVGVGDGEVALSQAILLLHAQLHHVGRAEMRGHHRHRLDDASAGLRRRWRWEGRRRHQGLAVAASSARGWSSVWIRGSYDVLAGRAQSLGRGSMFCQRKPIEGPPVS